MIFTEKKLKGVFEIRLEPHEDNRGFFMRTYDSKTFADHGLDRHWMQESQSHSNTKGTLRGLHFQFPPHNEAKLIRLANGEAFFAFVDLRKGSKTFGKWDSAVLSAKKKNMLFVSKGFALGMCTLTDDCDLLYKMDEAYAPGKDGTIKWDDPELNIQWPIKELKIARENLIMSDKDKSAMSFKDFAKKHGGIEVQ